MRRPSGAKMTSSRVARCTNLSWKTGAAETHLRERERPVLRRDWTKSGAVSSKSALLRALQRHPNWILHLMHRSRPGF
jgi:hypothetical protein